MATVLIIDDDPHIRQLLCDLVVELGHVALAAQNGLVGWELAQNHTPTLILCDVMMPVMDGHSFVRLLRADPALGGTPVYLMSAAPSTRAVVGPGATGFIDKPFDLRQIEGLLRGLTP